MKYIIGILMIAAGIFMVWRTDMIMGFFGRSAWAESKLGSGGSWAFYKGIGVIVIIFAMLLMSGDVVSILDWLFLPNN